MTLGERLKKIRGGVGQSHFAKKIGVSQSSLSLYEIGSRVPDATTLRVICDSFRISPEWLLMGTGSMYRESVETADTSAVLSELKIQPIEKTSIEEKKTADASAVLEVQRELTEALKQGMEFQKQVTVLTQENADLRVQAERHLSRIRELERENDELRAMRKRAPDFRSQSGQDVG